MERKAQAATSELNLESEKVARGIYIQAHGLERLKIICNYCSGSDSIFYEGLDFKASVGADWLGPAITHLLTNHMGYM